MRSVESLITLGITIMETKLKSTHYTDGTENKCLSWSDASL